MMRPTPGSRPCPRINLLAVWRHLQAWTLVSLLITPAHPRQLPHNEQDPSYWHRKAMEDLVQALGNHPNTRIARNVILFLGDGMSMSTVTAARIFKGQMDGGPGEDSKLQFEDFPNIALAKTYNVDHQVADSAGTATAFLCGVKANYGTVGLDARAPRGDCIASKGKNVTCILELAQRAGKSTGLVTTSRITHATPAPLFAASPDRKWEVDSQLPLDARYHRCPDIAAQFVQPVGININVVMGGGRRNMFPASQPDLEYPHHHQKRGRRQDGRNLVEEWLNHKDRLGHRAEYVWNQQEFDRVNPDEVEFLLGLFEDSHMRFDTRRFEDGAGEPDLAEMVVKAIQILNKNPMGFFLLVEGGRIDHAHHANHARLALEETVALDKAVRAAIDTLGGTRETLMIVTADHSHAVTIGSYPKRGNPILGLTDYSDDVTRSGLSDVDYLPYTSMSYANGPGYVPRTNLSSVDVEGVLYKQAATIPLKVATHEGSDVPIYAAGPMAHLLHSTHEQNYIFHVMSYAACLGDNRGHCERIEGSAQRLCGYSCHEAYIQSSSSNSRGETPVVSILLLAVCFQAGILTLIGLP